MSEPNDVPGPDPLTAEEEAEWRDRADWCSCDEYRNPDYGRLFATLDAARAAHPESRPEPGELREALTRIFSLDSNPGVVVTRATPEHLADEVIRELAARGYQLASPIPTDRPEPIDEERLARAIHACHFGGRHLSMTDHDADLWLAKGILAAYRTEPGETT